jgi:hypothetical protein
VVSVVAVSGADVTNIVIAVAVVGLLIYRQLKIRPVRERTAARLVLILGVIGVVEMVDAAKGHSLSAQTFGWLALGIAVGAGLGAARAVSVQVWRDDSGVAWRRGTVLTAGLWIVSLAAHFGSDALVDHSTTAKGLGSASILLYLAVSLGVQRELIRWRAARLPAGGQRSAARA